MQHCQVTEIMILVKLLESLKVMKMTGMMTVMMLSELQFLSSLLAPVTKSIFFYINQNIETKLYPEEKRANRKVASVFVPVVIDDCDDDESVE